jgi:hypothetical protein
MRLTDGTCEEAEVKVCEEVEQDADVVKRC